MSGRLAALRRAPFAPAALALAAFAAAGVAVLDDYGVAVDEALARLMGQTVINSVLPGAADLPADRTIHDPRYGPALEPYDRYYGAVFEAPLILAERLLGSADTRAVFLLRHLLTHLFFLTGGWFCYLLVYRLFGDRWLALFALLLFLLHPRLYAHSFYNSKDIPFLAMFMIALFLLERAFRRGTAAAFAACGVGVGVLINLRVMGIMLFAAALGLRALDLLQARGAAARRRVLAAAAAFVLAAAGTLYAISPYLWRDPFAIADAIAMLSRHTLHVITLFQGVQVQWPSIPPHYLPTWMAITTPPAALLLCLIGAAAAVRNAIARPRGAFGNTRQRFPLLLAACLVLPAAAIAALRSNIYDGWRHMYFLYAPLCLLSVYGLRALLAGARRPGAAGSRLRRRRGIYLRRGLWLRRGLCAAAAAALAGAAVDLVRLHPHQQEYFNFLVDRRTPERLRTQYRMTYFGIDRRAALQYLLQRFPGAALHVDTKERRYVWLNRLILPAEERSRIVLFDDAGRQNHDRFPHFFIAPGRDDAVAPVVYERRSYHNTVLAVTAVDLPLLGGAAGYRAAYSAAYHAAHRVAVVGEPLARLDFDLYLDGAALTYVKEACGPEDAAHRFLLRVIPAAVEDLPARRRDGAEQLDFWFGRYGVRSDGRCLIRRPLPDYPIRALEVGRLIPEATYLEAVIDLTPAVAPAAGD